MYHVILAGGSGSRFWPQSRKNKPKQLLKIIGDDSLIRLTYKRLEKISPANHILVVASLDLCKSIQKEIPEIPEENFIIEPSGKNTAPAIGLAALHILKRDPNSIMGVYPADHLIIEEDKFKEVVSNAIKMAEQKNSLITIGIEPTYPATGYGYIQYDSSESNEVEGIYKIKKFIEKPREKNAKKYLDSGEFLWNSGIFIWKAENILFEIKTLMPELQASLNAINDAISTSQYATVLDDEWKIIAPVSIDYGILEKSDTVYTIKANFQWNDLGSWQSLFSILPKNTDQNYYDGDVISIQSKNNLVISPNRLTAVVGVKDLTIINLDDATLIVQHKHSEAVKDVVNMIKSLNRNEYL